MVCYTPMKVYPGAELNPETGKRPVVFSGTKSLIEGALYTLPCGGCQGCRMDAAQSWAIRGWHEARTNAFPVGEAGGSAFLTLTIEPAKLLPHNSVMLRSLQLFMKRLRFAVKKPVRYLECGEYGELRGRAHYHVLVFGFDFPDRTVSHTSKDGHTLYNSKLLSELWPFGRALIGSVSFQSARYVAAYVMKKWSGKEADAHYTRVSPVDGEFYRVEPEFASMSLKPGLGERWFSEFESDVFPSDEVIIDGQKRKPPRYYEKLFVAKHGEAAFQPIKRARKRRAIECGLDRTPERLATREESQSIRTTRLARSVD